MTRFVALLATVAFCLALPSVGFAQGRKFADPVRLKAGDEHLGGGRLYPSPAYHDINGDGQLDVVVGDLMGRVTVAMGRRGSNGPSFEAETKLMAADGKQLKFHNW